MTSSDPAFVREREPRNRRFDDRPLLVFWEMTKACPLACRHCRADAQLSCGPDELTTEEGFSLIEELAEIGSPRPILIFTGGDCLKRPDLFELARHARELHVPVAIAPAVSDLMTPEILVSLREQGVRTASLSLDGSIASTHEAIRGIPGHFELTREAIQLLQQHGFSVQVNTVVTASNVAELADIAALMHRMEINAWEVFFLITTGRGSSMEATTAAQNEAVCEFLVDAASYGFIVRTVEAPFFRRVLLDRVNGHDDDSSAVPPSDRVLEEHLRTRLRERLGPPTTSLRAPSAATRDGKGIIFVGSNGDIYPSGFLPLKLGNLRESPLLSIYRDHPLLKSVREASFLGVCGSCEHADLCGGSRSRAFAVSGNALQSDVGCLKVASASGDWIHTERTPAAASV